MHVFVKRYHKLKPIAKKHFLSLILTPSSRFGLSSVHEKKKKKLSYRRDDGCQRDSPFVLFVGRRTGTSLRHWELGGSDSPIASWSETRTSSAANRRTAERGWCRYDGIRWQGRRTRWWRRRWWWDQSLHLRRLSIVGHHIVGRISEAHDPTIAIWISHRGKYPNLNWQQLQYLVDHFFFHIWFSYS